MQVRILVNGDVVVNGEKRMMFEGSVYDLPLDAARQLIDSGGAEAVTKAVEGPPSDKAVRTRSTKGQKNVRP